MRRGNTFSTFCPCRHTKSRSHNRIVSVNNSHLITFQMFSSKSGIVELRLSEMHSSNAFASASHMQTYCTPLFVKHRHVRASIANAVKTLLDTFVKSMLSPSGSAPDDLCFAICRSSESTHSHGHRVVTRYGPPHFPGYTH